MFSKLMKRDFKIVENVAGLALISAMIILAGVVFMCAFGLNLGIDYEGGAKVEIELTDGLDSSTEVAFEKEMRTAIEEAGYTISDKMQKSPLADSNGYTYEFRLNYEIGGQNMGKTEESQVKFIESLNGKSDNADDKGFKGSLEEKVKEFLETNGSEQYEEGCVRIAVIGASSSKSLIRSTIIAIILALVAILVYIAIRFTLTSGIAAFTGLIHDVAFMIALTAIFQIPVNMTFIAAVITIIGYSINSSIVIFDKVRECLKSTAFVGASDTEIANYAIKHSLVKILLSILTTLIMVVALVIFSVSTIQEFIIPIIFGLIGGTFSALCLSPSLWVLYRKIGAKIKNKKA